MIKSTVIARHWEELAGQNDFRKNVQLVRAARERALQEALDRGMFNLVRCVAFPSIHGRVPWLAQNLW